MKAYRAKYKIAGDINIHIDTILVKDNESCLLKAILRKNNLKGYQIDHVDIMWSREVPLNKVKLNDLNVLEMRLYLEDFIKNKEVV